MTNIVTPSCVEELSQVVKPWQLTLRQLSTGDEEKRVRFTSLDNVLITNERWGVYLLGQGGTARNYVTVAGSRFDCPVYWQGEVLQDNRLAIAPANVECEFHTPDGADHWVILIPKDTFTGYFQVASDDDIIRRAGTLTCEPGTFRSLAHLVETLLDGKVPSEDSDEQYAMQQLLLSHVGDVLADQLPDSGDLRRRYKVFRSAIEAAESSLGSLTVHQLAAAVEVSQRVLELAFRENLNMTPHRYLKLLGLNRLHSNLLEASRQKTSVTQVMESLDLHEFGRTAGEFREIFNENPSEVFRSSPRKSLHSFLDLASPQPEPPLQSSKHLL